MREYIDQNSADFSNKEEDAYDMISVMANAPELLESKERYKTEEGEINMCEALRQWREEDKAAGRMEGRLEGRLEGAERVNELNQRLLKEGRMDELKKSAQNVKYQEELMKKYKI